MKENIIKKINSFCHKNRDDFDVWLAQDISNHLLCSWPNAFALLALIAASLLNYYIHKSSALLFSYLIPIFLLIAYPTARYFYAKTERYFKIFVDILCISLITSILHVIMVIHGIGNPIRNAPIQIILLIICTLSFYPTNKLAIIRNFIITMISLLFFNFLMGPELLKRFLMQFFSGFLVGSGLGFFFLTFIKMRYYFVLTESEAKRHAFKQLQKLVYPHQLNWIQGGEALEDTMPIGDSRACVISFDVIDSSTIDEPLVDLMQSVYHRCGELMMQNYTHHPLTSNAFRIKEMGDGFLCSIGFPFLVPNGEKETKIAIELAFQFAEIFDKEVDKLYKGTKKVYCSMGIAHGPIKGYFPIIGHKAYDLYGKSIVLATRYEQMRKVIFMEREKSHILTLQEDVYRDLPPHYQSSFECIDLTTKKWRVRDDSDAQRIYIATDINQKLGTTV